MKIVKKLITKNYYPRRKRAEFPKAGVYRIVFHTYGGKGTSLFNWFESQPTGGASAHYAVFKNGTIEQYVLDQHKASHATHQWWNDVSIGIEHQDDGKPEDKIRTPELYESSAQLVAHLCNVFGMDVYSRDFYEYHKVIYPKKTCPGGLDVDRIVVRAREIYTERYAPKPEPKPQPIEKPEYPYPAPEPIEPEPTKPPVEPPRPTLIQLFANLIKKILEFISNIRS